MPNFSRRRKAEEKTKKEGTVSPSFFHSYHMQLFFCLRPRSLFDQGTQRNAEGLKVELRSDLSSAFVSNGIDTFLHIINCTVYFCV
jgi:hypothetical protein